jgi:hypothetical protein
MVSLTTNPLLIVQASVVPLMGPFSYHQLSSGPLFRMHAATNNCQ